MYYLLAAFSGAITAVMVVANGQLTASMGLYSSTVFIHVTGLLFVLLLLIIKKQKLFIKQQVPIWLYVGGAIGVAVTVFNNMSFGRISISAIVALTLLGQSLASLIIDQVGFIGIEKRPFKAKKLIGIAFTAFGIAIMIFPININSWLPVLLSLLTGCSIVLSRTVNAVLSEKTGTLRSALINYIVGLIVSVCILIFVWNSEPLSAGFIFEPSSLMYFGGILGAMIVIISNSIVTKISSFYMTLFTFAGQIFTGLLCDMALSGAFSPQTAIGGVLVTMGLCVNLYIEKKS